MTEQDMCCGTTCDKQAVAKYIAELEQRNAELAAQVEIMRNAVDVTGAYKTNQALADAYNATPIQCLAEHDKEVAARAGKAGFFVGYSEGWNDSACSDPVEIDVDAAAQAYVNKILTGEIKV